MSPTGCYRCGGGSASRVGSGSEPVECLLMVVSRLKNRQKWVNLLALRPSPSSDER